MKYKIRIKLFRHILHSWLKIGLPRRKLDLWKICGDHKCCHLWESSRTDTPTVVLSPIAVSLPLLSAFLRSRFHSYHWIQPIWTAFFNSFIWIVKEENSMSLSSFIASFFTWQLLKTSGVYFLLPVFSRVYTRVITKAPTFIPLKIVVTSSQFAAIWAGTFQMHLVELLANDFNINQMIGQILGNVGDIAE